ncbi:MAG: hypothetical protein KGH71_00835 [Candidatus Micrarchaeota archaeon]|nr:hypothetical protein [Candidatus Micrarchaeota archaeon]
MVILNAPEEKPVKERQIILKDTQRPAPSRSVSNLENISLRNVVQESWRAKVKHDKHMLDLIDDHASNMQKLLGNAEYEIFCIHNLIANTKNMSKSEVKSYIKTIEGLAYFYNSKLGLDLTSALLTGLTFKAKNLDSLGRYYKLMINEIDSKIKKYEKKASKENTKLDNLALDLRYSESGIINRLFRRGKAQQLKTRISMKRRKLDRYNTAITRNRKVMESVHRMIKGSAPTVS